MPISTNRRQLEKDKFVDDGSGNAAVRIKLVGGGGSPAIPGNIYVAASVTVTGTRDGSPSAPYEDLDFMATEPTTQAEFDQQKNVIILDSETYKLPATVAMGIWNLDLGNGFLEDGGSGTVFEIDSGLRFGSTNAPTFYVQRNNNTISTAWTGAGFTIGLKSGGAAVSVLRAGVFGLLRSGDYIIADGTNGGTSCSSLPVFSMYRASFDSSGTFKCRNSLVSLTQATFSGTGDLEVGYFTGIQSSTINSLNVLESRASTTTKTVRDLILNTSGGVTWTTSTRTWNVDVPSADEIESKISSYPSATTLLLKADINATDYSNGFNDPVLFLDTARFDDHIVAGLEASGVTHGVTQTLTFDALTVRALLDGGANVLTTIPAGGFVTDVYFVTVDAAGSAATVNIGTNGIWSVVNNKGFTNGADLNTAGTQQRTTVDGLALQYGVFSGGGDIVIESSGDVSASSWTGLVIVEYTINNGL